jgi:hypothetical protein
MVAVQHATQHGYSVRMADAPARPRLFQATPHYCLARPLDLTTADRLTLRQTRPITRPLLVRLPVALQALQTRALCCF